MVSFVTLGVALPASVMAGHSVNQWPAGMADQQFSDQPACAPGNHPRSLGKRRL